LQRDGHVIRVQQYLAEGMIQISQQRNTPVSVQLARKHSGIHVVPKLT